MQKGETIVDLKGELQRIAERLLHLCESPQPLCADDVAECWNDLAAAVKQAHWPTALKWAGRARPPRP